MAPVKQCPIWPNDGRNTVGINKLIKDLQKQLSKSKKKGKAPLERIDSLLLELGLKEKKLKHKLAREKDSGERKRLKLNLKIAQLQLKKGKKKRAEMAKK